ncbi:uncharacterized protein LOC134788131 isoform X1 [Penaeus indicus]|uniref:uncharacterized protein LOC134788131 isoform X1 n=2 Tax=Penaeus indicus TaxID=29960 RepID=UPI00300CB373
MAICCVLLPRGVCIPPQPPAPRESPKMPVDTEGVISLVIAVCREEEMEVVIKETFLGTLWNLFFKAGPNNYARAGLVERAESDNKPEKKTKRVEVIIEQDLTPEQHEELADSVRVAVKDLGFTEISPQCIEQWSVKRRIIEVVRRFFEFQLNMEIV